MDDKKEKKQPKKINIKNKKAATLALSKASNTKTKKAPPKKVKKEPKQEKKVTQVIETPQIKETKKKEIKKKETVKKEIKKKDTKEQKVKKKKESKKSLEKTKIIIPKEWQGINKKTPKEKTQLTDETVSGRLKSSIFEEVDEKTYQIQKKKRNESIKKTFLILLIIAVIVALTIFLVLKYNDHLREQLKVYDTYSIGEKVKLKDDTTWYVVLDSGAHESTIKLLSESTIDIDENGKKDDKDKKKYNEQNSDVYDKKDENSIAFYLESDYKVKEEEKVGKIEEVSLLTSKEFVKIRERMGFGYEWSTGNWLASPTLGTWWIISSQNEKIYVVTAKGTYTLTSSTALNYVRPVITISKDSVIKIKEESETESDILKGIVNFEKNENKD